MRVDYGIMRLALVAIVLAPTPSSAASEPNEGMRWIVDWADQNCNLMRAGPDNPLAFKVWRRPDAEKIAVTFGNQAWKSDPTGGAAQADIVLLPSGQHFSGHSKSQDAKKGKMVEVHALEPNFLDTFAKSEGIALEVNGNRLFDMSFRSSSKGLREFQRCTDTMLERWGINLTARALLQKRAVAQNVGGIFEANDYPEDARRRGIRGTVLARLDVDAEGRVQRCTAVNDLAVPILSKVTCSRATKRLRFEPAVGSDGKPTASQEILCVNWMLP